MTEQSREEELVRAFREGRLTRRAFVRQMVDGGMDLPGAIAYADVLVPAAPLGAGATSEADAGRGLPERPVQAEDLEISFVGDGYVVYQPAKDRMHSLNHVAAVVLELCTGENDAEEIARLLQAVYELPKPPEAEIRQCLLDLYDEGLVR